MKKRRGLLSVVMALMLVCSMTMTVNAGFTPKYEIDMPEVPEINVELSDEMKAAVDAAVQKQIEKMILPKPEVKWASFYQSRRCAMLSVCCSEVEGAPLYKVEVTKLDGMKKIYDMKYPTIAISSYCDPFIAENMEGATVRVRAYGENDTYSMWSDMIICSTVGGRDGRD